MNGNLQSVVGRFPVLILGLFVAATSAAQGKVMIATTTLPAGAVGVSYSQVLSTTGGKAPYTWSVSGGALPGGLSLSSGGTIGGSPTGRGTFPFTVKVLDGAGDTDTRPLQIIVNSNPLITTETLPNAVAGSTYSATLAASGTVPPVTWTVSLGTLPAGLSLAASTGIISGMPSAAGTASFTVRLVDSGGGSTTRALSLTVNAALGITTSSLVAGTVGTVYTQALGASGGVPPYSWTVSVGTLPSGLTLSAGGTISGTPGTAGTSNFTVKVTDSASGITTKALSLTINPAALSISTASLPAGTVGTAYSQALAASGGLPPYSWTVSVGTLPAGLTLSAGGTISGTPGAAGTSNFTVKVTDSASGNTTKAMSLTINPAALSISTASLPAGTVGTVYSQALVAAGGVPPYSWTVSVGTLPGGLTLSAGGTISGTPGTAGTSNFTVKVTDSASGANTTKALSLTINPPALSISTSSLAAGTVGTAYSQALGASGGVPPYSWTVSVGTLPSGLTLSAGGTISGTPGTAGTSSFTVKVTDSASVSTTAALSLTINPPTLSITTSSLPAGVIGAAYSQALGASGGVPPYSWTVSVGTLPSGLTLSAGGTISGTPGTAGTSSFTVKVTDSASVSTTAALSLTINPPTLSISTSSLAAGTVGTAYSQALGASGGVPPYSWSVSVGTLPSGFTLSAGGTISGTPGSAGTSNFTVKVTDSASISTTAALSLTINPPTLSISTSSLAAGTVGTAYSQALGASGGVPPYSWTVSVGTLPSGLTLSAGGTISGTPGTAGTSSFTVKVTDSATVSATAALSLTINPPTLSISTSSLPAGVIGAAYSQPLAASGGVPPYSWSVSVGTPPSGLTLSAGGTISGTPDTAGTSNFTVKVTDSASVSTTAALSLTINPATLSIAISSLPAGIVGTAYSQALGASGGVPPYSWSVSGGSLPSGLTLSAGGMLTGTPGTAGASSFTVKVTDGASVAATAALSLTITPPALSITTASLPPGVVGTAYSQVFVAAGGSPPYAWSLSSGSLPGGLTLSANGTISGTPLSSGPFSVTVQVSDSAGIKTTNTFALQIQLAPVQIITASLPPYTSGASYSQTLTATGGSPPFTWSLGSGSLPTGLALDPGGTIRGTPTTAGSYTFSARVTDSAGASAVKAYAITINGVVSIETNSLADALIGAPYSQLLKATAGTPPYFWSLTSGAMPDGITLDSSGGSLSGTPSVVGSFRFTLRVEDSVHAFAERAFQITTAAGLIITTAPVLAPATVGLQYGQSLDAAGGRAPYVWSISSGGLPAGVTLNTTTGALGGIPSAAGTFQFTVDVSDSLARKASKQFSLVVAAALGISSAPTLPGAMAGVTYSQALAATGGTPPYLWSITSGGLPAGLSFDAGTAAISGVPTLGGSFTFTVQVSDNNSVTASKQFTLAVTSNLTITTGSPLPDATVGATYARVLVAAGGVAPYVWAVKSGSLPLGLALDGAGNAIAGTPTLNGSFAFTLQVADASGGSAVRDYVLAVSLPPLPSVSLDGLPDPTNAADQPTFGVSLATAYPVQLTGQIVATFTADADVAIDDAAIQFPTGGRTVNFTIPTGNTTAVFSTSQMALQTGTVAGTITLNLSLQSAKGEVTETSTRTLHVLRAAPVIRGLQVVHTPGGFEVRLTAYSTPRQLTQAAVQLTPAAGSNLQTTQITIPLTDLAATWYKSSASNAFGSQFMLVLPFTIQGDGAGIDSVSVSLVNSQGSSSAVSGKF